MSEEEKRLNIIKEKLKKKKRLLVYDMSPILDSLADDCKARNLVAAEGRIQIPFDEFVVEFNRRTESDFEKRYLGLKKYMQNWELAQAFQDVPHKTMLYNLYEDKSKNRFIMVEDVNLRQFDRLDHLPEELLAECKSLSLRYVKPKVVPQSGRKSLLDSWETLHREKIVFTAPCWPGVSDEFREQNQKKYAEVCRIYSEPKKLAIESRHLAKIWWKPRVGKWAQLLYLLSKLEKFQLTELDKSLKNVFPEEWKENREDFKINYEMFGISKSKLVELNLIVRTDQKNARMFTTNKIIKYCEYETIRDEIASLLYDFSVNFNYKYVDEADEMLFKNHIVWCRHKKSERIAELRNVLNNNNHIFEYDNRTDQFSAILYNNVIFVPMLFSPFNC